MRELPVAELGLAGLLGAVWGVWAAGRTLWHRTPGWVRDTVIYVGLTGGFAALCVWGFGAIVFM